MEEDQPKKKRIGLGMGIALVFVAVCFDLLGVILTALAPAIGGVIVDCIGVLVFLPWLYLLNVSLISPKQSIQWVINMGADFGTVGIWCGFTIGTILTIVVVYFEDKTHVPVTALMSGKNMSRKMLRRLKNPKKALEAQQRLRQMNQATRAKISGARGFSFQESGVAGVPSGSIQNERPVMKDINAPQKITSDERIAAFAKRGYLTESEAARIKETYGVDFGDGINDSAKRNRLMEVVRRKDDIARIEFKERWSKAMADIGRTPSWENPAGKEGEVSASAKNNTKKAT